MSDGRNIKIENTKDYADSETMDLAKKAADKLNADIIQYNRNGRSVFDKWNYNEKGEVFIILNEYSNQENDKNNFIRQEDSIGRRCGDFKQYLAERHYNLLYNLVLLLYQLTYFGMDIPDQPPTTEPQKRNTLKITIKNKNIIKRIAGSRDYQDESQIRGCLQGLYAREGSEKEMAELTSEEDFWTRWYPNHLEEMKKAREGKREEMKRGEAATSNENQSKQKRNGENPKQLDETNANLSKKNEDNNNIKNQSSQANSTINKDQDKQDREKLKPILSKANTNFEEINQNNDKKYGGYITGAIALFGGVVLITLGIIFLNPIMIVAGGVSVGFGFSQVATDWYSNQRKDKAESNSTDSTHPVGPQPSESFNRSTRAAIKHQNDHALSNPQDIPKSIEKTIATSPSHFASSATGSESHANNNLFKGVVSSNNSLVPKDPSKLTQKNSNSKSN